MITRTLMYVYAKSRYFSKNDRVFLQYNRVTLSNFRGDIKEYIVQSSHASICRLLYCCPTSRIICWQILEGNILRRWSILYTYVTSKWIEYETKECNFTHWEEGRWQKSTQPPTKAFQAFEDLTRTFRQIHPSTTIIDLLKFKSPTS